MKELEFARHLDFCITIMEHFKTCSNSWLHSPRNTQNRTHSRIGRHTAAELSSRLDMGKVHNLTVSCTQIS